MLEIVSNKGAREALKPVKVQFYYASICKVDAVCKIEKEASSKAREEYILKVSFNNNRFFEVMEMVVEAQAKNFIRENSLKLELFTQLRNAGIASPVPVIDRVFNRAASPYFRGVLHQASQWLEMSDEAFGELKRGIEDLEFRQLDETVNAGIEESYRAASDMSSSSSPSTGIPLRSTSGVVRQASPSKEDDTLSKYRQIFGNFRGRH